jgi:hypothetical protein
MMSWVLTTARTQAWCPENGEKGDILKSMGLEKAPKLLKDRMEREDSVVTVLEEILLRRSRTEWNGLIGFGSKQADHYRHLRIIGKTGYCNSRHPGMNAIIWPLDRMRGFGFIQKPYERWSKGFPS